MQIVILLYCYIGDFFYDYLTIKIIVEKLMGKLLIVEITIHALLLECSLLQ